MKEYGQGNMNNDDYEKIKREIIFEKVAKAMREDRKNWIKNFLLHILKATPNFRNRSWMHSCLRNMSRNPIIRFEELALDFYTNTEPDGFDALYELCEKYGPDSEKGMIVREIIEKQKSEPEL